MKRLILAATATAVLTAPAVATPYREFVDVKRRATAGETVIRAFPNARKPSFRLILINQGIADEGFCSVWIEFVSRGGPFDHFGDYGIRAGSNRRGLVNGPHFIARNSINFDGVFIRDVPFLEQDIHWVARGTNDALQLVRVDVGVDDNGDCVAGTDVRFTPNLSYRDVVDDNTLMAYGEVRILGFPGNDPTFTLFLEYLEEGTVLEQGGSTKTLTGDVCAMTLEFAPGSDVWTPDLLARLDNFSGNRSFLHAVGPGAENPTE
jgi:hypothetical protein